MRRLIVIVAAVAVSAVVSPAAVYAGGGGCDPAGGMTAGRGHEAVTVAIEECAFSPTVVYVEPGDTVGWVNREGLPHTVTGAGLTWGDGEILERDDAVRHSFQEEGIYPYFCALHPGMVGAVVVGDPAGVRGSADPIDVDVSAVDPPVAEPIVAPPDAVPAGATADSGVTLLQVLPIVVLALILGWALAPGRPRRRTEED